MRKLFSETLTGVVVAGGAASALIPFPTMGPAGWINTEGAGGLNPDDVSVDIVCTASTVSVGNVTLNIRWSPDAAANTGGPVSAHDYDDSATSAAAFNIPIVTAGAYFTKVWLARMAASGSIPGSPLGYKYIGLLVTGATTGNATYTITVTGWSRT